MKDKVLITGGLGYIGSHIYLSLIKKNYFPIIIDNLSTSNISVKDKLYKITSKEVIFHEGDIRNKDLVRNIVKNYQIDTIIHLAGKKSVKESIIYPEDYIDNNLGGTQSILNAIEGTTCKKIIFSSSALVYGNTKQVPINESHPLNFTNPYAESKILCEKLLMEKSKNQNNLIVGVLRYFNPAGADKNGLIGDNPTSIYKNLFAILDDISLGIQKEFKVFGDDYDTFDGTCVRDYLHISDLADGHVKLIETLNLTSSNQVFNLGSGRGYSVLEVLKEYERANSIKFKIKIDKKRIGDVPILKADITRANTILNWNNKFNLNDMCKSSLKFRKLHYPNYNLNVRQED